MFGTFTRSVNISNCQAFEGNIGFLWSVLINSVLDIPAVSASDTCKPVKDDSGPKPFSHTKCVVPLYKFLNISLLYYKIIIKWLIKRLKYRPPWYNHFHRKYQISLKKWILLYFLFFSMQNSHNPVANLNLIFLLHLPKHPEILM